MSTLNGGVYYCSLRICQFHIDANKRIKGIQIEIGDHEIKLVNFADEITFLLADITCLNRINMI